MAAGGADVIGTHLEIGGVLFVCRHDSVVEVGRPAPSQHQVGQAKRNLSSQEVFINTCKKMALFFTDERLSRGLCHACTTILFHFLLIFQCLGSASSNIVSVKINK
jgi:hypothetical protein